MSFNTKKDNKFFKENETLGHKNFLLDSDDAEDIWGRPTTKWFKDKDENGKYTDKETVYAEITAKADAEFNEPTTQCDICEALGEKTSAKVVEVYVNGAKTTTEAKALAETYKATETKAKVGEQGRIAEYYKVDGGYRSSSTPISPRSPTLSRRRPTARATSPVTTACSSPSGTMLITRPPPAPSMLRVTTMPRTLTFSFT